MTSFKYFSALLLLGCSGSDFSAASAEQDGGFSGEPNGSGGFEADSNIEPTIDSGSGGSNNIEEDGGINNSGGSNSGGSSNTGGTINNTGGSENTGGNGGETCIPTTCLNYAIQNSNSDTSAIACGIIEDGCGGYLDCGTGCEGFESLLMYNTDTFICNKNTNLCQDGCRRALPEETGGSISCTTAAGPALYSVCDINISAPPYTNRCEFAGTGLFNSENYWCCGQEL